MPRSACLGFGFVLVNRLAGRRLWSNADGAESAEIAVWAGVARSECDGLLQSVLVA